MGSPHATTSHQAQTTPAADTARHPNLTDARQIPPAAYRVGGWRDSSEKCEQPVGSVGSGSGDGVQLGAQPKGVGDLQDG